MAAMDKFYLWESASRDIIDFKKIYVDMAGGDVLAGLALSEIVFWYLPSRTGESKLRVEHDGKMWIAVRRYDWWARTRMSPDQADRVLAILLQRGLIEKQVYRFSSMPTLHVRLVEDRFLALWNQIAAEPLVNPYLPKHEEIPFSPNGENGPDSVLAKQRKPFSPNGENSSRQMAKTLTESTTESTSENTDIGRASAPAPVGEQPESIIKNKSAFNALRTWEQGKGDIDFSDYPEQVHAILKEFCRLWNMRPPAKSPRKGGEFALWISQARELMDACGEIGLPALQAAYSKWSNTPINERIFIGRPGSVLALTRSEAAKLRAKSARGTPPETWESFRQKWLYRYEQEPTQQDYQQYVGVH